MIHRIMADEEMSSVHTLAIVLNCRETSDLYQQIYSKENLTSNYTVNFPDKVDEELAAKQTGSRNNQSTKVFSDQFGVQSSVMNQGNKEDSNYPNKDFFLQRFKFSKEFLDLGEICLGMNNQNIENQNHKYIMIDVFDIGRSKDQ